MQIEKALRNQLRAAAHHLRVIVTFPPCDSEHSQDGAEREFKRALNDHELVKIRVLDSRREERINLFKTLCEKHGATLITSIGKVATLYRPSASPKNKSRYSSTAKP